MANPPSYTPSFSFAAYQATDPVDPLPGIKVDVELANIATSVNAGIYAVEDIRRSDSTPLAPHLNNGLVHWETLDASIQAMFGVPSWVGSAGLVLAPYASQADAVAGTDAVKVMTPLTVQQGITGRLAAQSDAIAGTDGFKLMTPLAVAQAIGAWAEGDAVANIAALRALNNPTFSRALVLGYYTARDGGGGDYIVDATDTTSADNGGTIIVSADLKRWKLSTQAIMSVKQFGAKGDTISVTGAVTIASGSAALTVAGASFTAADVGKIITVPGAAGSGGLLATAISGWTSATQVTLSSNAATTLTASSQTVTYGSDDASVFNGLLASLSGTGSIVHIPPGKYTLGSQINYVMPAGLSFTLAGSGSGVTILHWPSATGGVNIAATNSANTFKIRDMSFTTSQVNSGTALHFAGVGANSGQYFQSYIHDVQIAGDDNGPALSSHYWATGILIHNWGSIDLSNVNTFGPHQSPTSAGGGIGLVIEGDTPTTSYTTIINCSRCSFNSHVTGVQLGNYWQGVTFDQCNFNGAVGGSGIQAVGTAGVQVLLTVTNSQFNTGGIQINLGGNGVGNPTFIGNTITIWVSAQIAIQQVGAYGMIIQGNIFNTGAGVTGAFGIVSNGAGGIVLGNSFSGPMTPVDLQPGSTNWGVNLNRYSNGTSANINNGTGNSLGVITQ